MVLTGVVNGVRTLAIAFRGTDQYADWLDALNFNDHYARFKPLIDAIHDYINDPINGITSVLVSGHSLGAGMASISCGIRLILRGNTRFRRGRMARRVRTNPEHRGATIDTDDPVAKVPFITQPGVEAAIIAAFSALGTLPGTAVAALAAAANRKFREGSNVFLNSDIGNFLSFSEHSKTAYTLDVAKLYSYATDTTGSPFSTTRLLAIPSTPVPKFRLRLQTHTTLATLGC
ncbi:DUF2974 domain-containing protein [Bradyrhizobium sp. JYMT SZCCT0428]|nr:DUF2974 domain-containing protein [Bradyrhizobium sp. JYMT SZCCT0428]